MSEIKTIYGNTLADTVAREDLINIDGYEKISSAPGYIHCGSPTINVNSVTANTNYRHVLDACSEGDKYIVNGVGGATPKIWCFVSSTGSRIKYATQSNYTSDLEMIIAPANAAYLISNYQPAQKDRSAVYKVVNDSIARKSQPILSSHVYAVDIPSNSDLDNYTAIGNYKIATTAIAQTVSHVPEEASGRLSVFTIVGSGSVHQWYISANAKWYIRELISESWSDWKRLADLDWITTRLESYLSLASNYSSSISANSDFDDITTPGNYIVPNVATAATISNIPEGVSGRLSVMTLAGSSSVHQIYIASSNNLYARELIGGVWSKWKHYADYDYVISEASKSVGAKGAYNALQPIIRNSQYDIAFANAFTPLTLENYLGNTQNVHPKVLYFADGFGGHKYWMAYTPYPYSRDGYENPCIAYSDDGYKWTNINNNPLDDPAGNGYYSDTHLVYNGTSLECWYRYVGPATQSPREETIYRQTSSDGVTWSTKEAIYSNTSGQYAKLLSPAVIIENGKYCIWVVNGDDASKVDYYEAPVSNVANWTKVRSITFSITDSGISVKPWHLDVIKDGTDHVLLLMCRNGTSISNNACSLFIATSSDNTTYNAPIKVVGGADNWDRYMYRSSIVKVGNKYRVYYSASGGGTTTIYNNAVWGIGITESDALTNGYIGYFE